jgi:hypothetical protein
MVSLKGTGEVLNNAKKAERVISPPIYNKEDGTLLAPAYTVPDHTMRLEAVKISAQFAKDFKPSAPAAAIALNIGNTVNNNNNSGSSGPRSFEQRVRDLREKRGLHNDGNSSPIQDAVIEDINAAADDGDDDELDDDAEYLDDGADDTADTTDDSGGHED